MIIPDRTSSSPFFNPFRPTGQGVVIHATRSGQFNNPNELQGTLNWFRNPAAQVSAHWVVGDSGEKVRVIGDSMQAWHAGKHNATHWGIEVCQGTTDEPYFALQIQALVDICKGYIKDFGVPAVHNFNGFIGHEETPQGIGAGKSDPGSMFPWSDFIMKLQDVPPAPRVWIYGNEMAGCELRGKQQFIWNQGVEVDAIGDYNGDFPGAHYHNQGGAWVQVLP